MKAGRLRHVIIVEEALESQDDVGQVVQTWSAVKTLRAEIDSIRGDERFVLKQAGTQIDAKITVRGQETGFITSKHRIKAGDHVYDIESVLDLNQRGIKREIYCTEAA